jgi:hypothetical protein
VHGWTTPELEDDADEDDEVLELDELALPPLPAVEPPPPATNA